MSALGLYFWLSASGNTILADYIKQTIDMLNVPAVKNGYVKEMGIASFNTIVEAFKILSPKDIAIDEIIGLKGKNSIGCLSFYYDFFVF